MENRIGCGKNKELHIWLNICINCPKDKIKTVCPSDVFVLYDRYLEETDQITYELVRDKE